MMDMNEPMETKKHQETHATKIDDSVTSPILVAQAKRALLQLSKQTRTPGSKMIGA